MVATPPPPPRPPPLEKPTEYVLTITQLESLCIQFRCVTPSGVLRQDSFLNVVIAIFHVSIDHCTSTLDL